MPEAVVRFPEGRYEGEVNISSLLTTTKGCEIILFQSLIKVNGDKLPEGKGCLEFPGNDAQERQFYEGDFMGKTAHGNGVLKWREGEKYEGQFENGLRHGQGTYTSKVKKITLKTQPINRHTFDPQ